VLDASGESLTLLFLLVVLVSEAGNRGGHSHTKVTYEACFHVVVCALHSFSRSWKHLQTGDCVLEYASSTGTGRPAAVAHSEVLVAVFVRICEYDIVAVKLQWP